MHLISSLAAGVAGASNGSCTIFKRGTSTWVTYYTDFEGTVAKTPAEGSEVTLDSNGRLIAYVNELSDVVVKDSTGATVATFTEGASSPVTEVRSQSFTGTNYETAATDPSYPTTLQAVLDLWRTNSGSADWKARGVTLAQLYDQTYTVVNNVKRFGAQGLGIQDDTSYIQDAIDASGGGPVYLPKGTYRITSALTLTQSSSLIGAGSEGTVITMDDTTANFIELTASLFNVGQGIRIEGIEFKYENATSTGTVLNINQALPVHVEDCYFDCTNHTGTQAVLTTASAAETTINRCLFEIANTTSSAITTTASGGQITVTDCKFDTPASYAGSVMSLSTPASIARCTFNTGGNSVAASSSYINIVIAMTVSVEGCRFNNPSSGTVWALRLTVATVTLHESGNIFGGSNVTPVSFAVAGTISGRLESRTTYEVTDNSAALSLDVASYDYFILTRTSNGAQTISVNGPNYPPPGSRFILIVRNNTGAAMSPAITLNTSHFRQINSLAPSNGSIDIRHFVVEDVSGTTKCTQITSALTTHVL